MKAAQDSVVREARRQREKLSARFGHDLLATVADNETRQAGNPRLVTRRSKRGTRTS
jgi:hypothetical protein